MAKCCAPIPLVTLFVCLLSGCGTGTIGRLEGKNYVSKTGDITCTFPMLTRDVRFEDYSGNDGEWVSNNLSGVDIERIERFALGKGSVPVLKDVNVLIDTLLPFYTAPNDRIKGAKVLVRKPVSYGSQNGVFTLVEFSTYSSQNYPPNSIDYRGIFWFLGDKYGTSLHVYNWHYKASSTDAIEARLAGLMKNCSFRG